MSRELAKKRDESLKSDQARMCLQAQSLGVPERKSIYLRNRLITAFLAGAKAQEEILPSESQFHKGIVHGAARLIEMHDQPTMALDILREAGLTEQDYKKCYECDLVFIRKQIDVPKGVE